MSKHTLQKVSRNIYSWTSISDPSKVVVYFQYEMPGPDKQVYFTSGGLGLSIQRFLEVAPAKGHHARKRYWTQFLGAKKYP